MDYSKICSEILKINPKIRFAGVYDTINGEVYNKVQDGVKILFTKEQSKTSMIKAYGRWKSRRHLKEIIGEPVYTMTKYTKINRITMPCGENGLLMISTEVDLEPHEIINDILKIEEKFADKEGYAARTSQMNF